MTRSVPGQSLVNHRWDALAREGQLGGLFMHSRENFSPRFLTRSLGFFEMSIRNLRFKPSLVLRRCKTIETLK